MNPTLICASRLLIAVTLTVTLPLQALAQLPPEEPPAAEVAAPAPVAPSFENCRPLTDKALAIDLRAAMAQSQKRDIAEQLKVHEEAVAAWSQALAECDGRASERAQRNLADSEKMRNSLSEQDGGGPQCEAAHKDAASLQEMARQTLSERRFDEAAMLFRKTENRWDLAFERCNGTQQELAGRRRDQSAMDSHNAEFCAVPFEKAREQHQKLRASAAGMSREEKQEASQVAETLWRNALEPCKGPVLETVRNNAQTLARERGTPWVARKVPSVLPAAPAVAVAAPLAPQARAVAAAAASPRPASLVPAVAAAAAAATAASAVAVAEPAVPEAQPREFVAGSTRFNGVFFRDTDGLSYSGTGQVTWASGDRYEGTLVKGQRHGKGVFNWANGQRYSGGWVNDVPEGEASLHFAGGNQYEGRVSKGVPDGLGRMRYPSGDTYSGQFKAGVPDGRGSYVMKNGQQMEGDWKNQQISGQGSMVFPSGDTYTGQFALGKPAGEGRYRWSNGDEYVGQWKAGQKHGQGAFVWKNGDRWEGRYNDDEQTSEGQLTQKP